MVLSKRDYLDRNRVRMQGASPVVEELEGRRLLAGTLGFNVHFGYNDELSSGSAIAVDAQGNTYIAGSFHGTVNFNTGHSKKAVSVSKNGSDDLFLAKYDPKGILIWHRQYGGDKGDGATALKLGPDGDIFLAGFFQEVAQFGTSKQPLNLTSRGKKDAFVARIDATGKMLWAGNVGGGLDDTIAAIATGNDGDVYVTGTIRRRGDINPTRTAQIISCRGADDTFIMRLNGDNGAPRWKRVFGENDTSEDVTAMSVDPEGGVYVGGNFVNKVQFERGSNAFTLKSRGDNDIFIGRLTPNGAWDWLKQVGADNQDYLTGLERDPTNGDLYITGTFGKTVVFGPGPGAVTRESISEHDAYVSRLRDDGSFVWTQQFGGKDSIIRAAGLAIDPAGNVYTTGDISDDTTFSGGGKSVTLIVEKDGDAPPIRNQPEAANAYITKLSPDGTLIYARQIGGKLGNVLPHAIAADEGGNAYVTGAFTGIIDIDPGPGVKNIHTNSVDDHKETDVFVVQVKA